ncbi:unnamed protein product [Laminaria digitata]
MMTMALLKKSLCFAAGVVVASAAASIGPGSSVYSLQGGGSGMEQGGDYVENKIARGLQGVFGAAADEAKHGNRHFNLKGKVGWPFGDSNKGGAEVQEAPATLSWVGGAKTEAVKEQHTVVGGFWDTNFQYVPNATSCVVATFCLLWLHA